MLPCSCVVFHPGCIPTKVLIHMKDTLFVFQMLSGAGVWIHGKHLLWKQSYFSQEDTHLKGAISEPLSQSSISHSADETL